MRRTQHGNQPGVSEEAAFEFGVVYTTIKNHLVTFAESASNSYSFADIASRVARLLESEALRQQHGFAELVPQMRQDGAANRRGRWARGGDAASAPLFGGAPRGRTLSAKARKAISNAQRLRWKLAKQKSRATGEASINVKTKGKLKPGQILGDRSSLQKSYWAKMSPAARSREIMRRKQVAAAKKTKQAGGKLRSSARGLWPSQITSLLAHGPKSRQDVTQALRKRFPNKENAITVALAAMKRKGGLLESGGIFTLSKAAVNGAESAA